MEGESMSKECKRGSWPAKGAPKLPRGRGACNNKSSMSRQVTEQKRCEGLAWNLMRGTTCTMWISSPS
eukprot:scaffold8973_cov19-Tisochrysis_lutea.AAC.1